jgi:hypothetical protein
MPGDVGAVGATAARAVVSPFSFVFAFLVSFSFSFSF